MLRRLPVQRERNIRINFAIHHLVHSLKQPFYSRLPAAPAHPLETDFDELVHKPHAASRNVPVVTHYLVRATRFDAATRQNPAMPLEQVEVARAPCPVGLRHGWRRQTG